MNSNYEFVCSSSKRSLVGKKLLGRKSNTVLTSTFRDYWRNEMTMEATLYHKINSIYKRDERGAFIVGDWSCPEFEYLQNNMWEFTEKVDGTNIRIWPSFYYDGRRELSIGGRTEAAQIPVTLTAAINSMLSFDVFANAFPGQDLTKIMLIGEGYGAKIQKRGGNYRQDQGFVLFDVMVNGIYLERHNVDDVAQKLGIQSVPVIGRGTLQDGINLVTRCPLEPNGLKSQWGDFEAEGIVARPVVEMLNRRGHRIITKIKSKDLNVESKSR